MDVFDSENLSKQQRMNLLPNPDSSSDGISVLKLGGLSQSPINRTLSAANFGNFWIIFGTCILPPVLPFVPEIEYHHPHGSCSIGLKGSPGTSSKERGSLFQVNGIEALHIQWSETFHCQSAKRGLELVSADESFIPAISPVCTNPKYV